MYRGLISLPDEVLMKHLLAALSTAFLTVFFAGSCSDKDASVTSTTSTKPPADLSEGSADKSAGQEAKALEIQDVEAETAEVEEEVKKDEAKTESRTPKGSSKKTSSC